MNRDDLLNLLMEWGEPITWECLSMEAQGVAKYRKDAERSREIDPDDKDYPRMMEQTAEGCRRRALERFEGLRKIRAGIREHAPKLLGMLPDVDLFRDPPTDFKALAATMRTIEGKLRKQLSYSESSPAAAQADKPSGKRLAPAEWELLYDEFQTASEDDPSLTLSRFGKMKGIKHHTTLNRAFKKVKAERAERAKRAQEAAREKSRHRT